MVPVISCSNIDNSSNNLIAPSNLTLCYITKLATVTHACKLKHTIATPSPFTLTPSSVPHSVRYNPISIPFITQPSHECKHHSSEHDNFSSNDNDFALPYQKCHTTVPTPSTTPPSLGQGVVSSAPPSHSFSKPSEKTSPKMPMPMLTPTPSTFAQHQRHTSQHSECSCEDQTHIQQNFLFKVFD